MVQIIQSTIDIPKIIESVLSRKSGGIDVFIGVTRDHSGSRSVTTLTYEAYEPMAIKVMEKIEQEARTRWPLNEVAMIHRLGEVRLSEASVVIAVSAAHRNEAFEACRYLIDQLKKEVPIWKIEHFADGAVERSGSLKEVRREAEVR